MTPKEEAIHVLELLEPYHTGEELATCSASSDGYIVDLELTGGQWLTFYSTDAADQIVDIIQKAIEAWRTR